MNGCTFKYQANETSQGPEIEPGSSLDIIHLYSFNVQQINVSFIWSSKYSFRTSTTQGG